MNVPLWAWLAVLAGILVMLAIDLFAHRRAHVIGVREAAAWSAFWVALGVGFGALEIATVADATHHRKAPGVQRQRHF